MQYFQAVQQGKQRASKSQMKMFEAAGFGMLTLTTKKVDGDFQPVGEEEFTAIINSPDGDVAIIVDKDGFTKAQSKLLQKRKPNQSSKNFENQEFLNIQKKIFKFGLKQDRQFKTKFLNNYFEERIISVPTSSPFMAFSIIFGSAFMILVLILERSMIFRARISIKS